MKIIKICAIALICCTSVNNQAFAKELKKGTHSIGGSTSYFTFGDREYDDGDTTKMFRIGATLGYLIHHNFEVGSGLSYGYNEYDSGTGTTKTEFYTLAPYLTKHIPLTAMSNFTLTGQIAYSKTKFQNGDSRSSKYWLVALGWEHFVSSNLAFNFSLNHEKSFDEDSRVTGYESTYTNLALKLYF